MSTMQAVGSIITDGLVLHLDAANYKSYPGSGTTWTDLTINANNGTLTNGPTFSSANGGSIGFDGISQYVTVPNVIVFGVGFTGTLEIVSNITGSLLYNERTTGNHWEGYFSVDSTGKLSVGADSKNATPYVYFLTSSILSDVTKINHYIASYQIPSVSGNMNGILGINGNFETVSGSIIVDTVSGNHKNIEIGRTRNYTFGTSYYSGKVFIARIYNRRLTQQEMLQNYNATKRRFGIL